MTAERPLPLFVLILTFKNELGWGKSTIFAGC